MSQKWDPLEEKPSDEIVTATIKRQIKNILKSYTGWYDPFSELIQNALDAVDHRRQLEASGKYEPHIWIKIDIKNKTLSVTDNGIGFSEEQFRNFLAPNVSYKKPNNRGNKGVGATYLGYGFNFLQIGTKLADYYFVGNMTNGREWVEDDSGTEVRPNIKETTKIIHEAFGQIDRGSTFSICLTGNYIRPKDLAYSGAKTASQWSVVLRVKTPLGGIYFNGEDYYHPKCHLTVIDENNVTTEEDIGNCEYLFPHKVISTCKSLRDINAKQQDLIKKRKDASKLPDSFYKLNGLYNYWTTDEIISDESKIQWSSNEKDLINNFKMHCYVFFCYSTDVWDKYNDDIVKLRKGNRILKGGLQLATNNMPQGDLIDIPLTRNTHYQNVTHIIAHYYGADPDLGRKGFQPELVDVAKKFSAGIVKMFINWRHLLKKETGAPPNIVAEKKIYDWIREQEEHEKSKPLFISRTDAFLPVKEPSLTSQPLNEQDVISLFNQLLAGGVIRGITIMSTSQHEQYDGICRIRLLKPFENHIFDKITNPLGVEESKVSEEFTSPPKVLEYKYSFSALLEEIEKEVKIEQQIGLVVAWDMGGNWQARYDITPLLHFDNLHLRSFHGLTHIIKSASTGDHVFYAIILSELIEYINDPDEAQDIQKTKYMSNI
ncbi:ATP-binding protein [Candidatus Magnetomonas plexicatena]|uniref:ATP-binding protein n=1 Tax=Candidatus Magnetomonas plexicatena TaxID=2552947 RepID=UPI00110090E5|nr:ATP-binding protein [Nitrospirales bacterium LBB_01]